MAKLSDNAKKVFSLVKEAKELGMDVTAAQIAEKLDTTVQSVNAIITFTFGQKKNRKTGEITQEPIMAREAAVITDEEGNEKKVNYIRLVDDSFDPEAVPADAE
jgi:capsular polysaccharide biosynthesis protein